MQGLDNDTSRYMNDYSGFQFNPDIFEGNYPDANHSMTVPSIVHHHEFPFEHAHRITPPNTGFGDFDNIRPQISFDAYSCTETGPLVSTSSRPTDESKDDYYNGENQSSSSRSNSSGSKKKKSNYQLTNEEKRRVTLEKNRQAASRCRKKRKFLLQDLERHAHEASVLNHTLTLRVQTLETQLQMAHEELRMLKSTYQCNL